MVQIVHHYNGVYPFGLEKQSEHTFLQVSKTDLKEDQIMIQRQKGKIYKNINSHHLIKLVKTLKEDSNLHFIYEYEDKSVENYIERLKKEMEGSLSKDKYKFLITEFKTNIDSIIDILIRYQIKADVFLSSIACNSDPTKGDSLMLKAFIDPEAEYLSLIEHDYRPKEGKKKDKSGVNQQFLNQFYEAERKRLMLDFEEILQKYFGKLHENQTKKQFPNFVISGTKLVFTNSEEKEIESEFKIKKADTYKGSQAGRQKISSKLEESKKTGVSERSRNSSPAGEKQFLKEVKASGKTTLPTPSGGAKSPSGPIVDFDQSFEPEFKPEEFLKEKTYIYEQDDYLNSLEEELNHMALDKKQNIEKKPKVQESNVFKQKVEVKEKVDSPSKKEKKMTRDMTNSQSSTQNNTQAFNNPSSQANQNNLSKESASLSNKSHSNNLSNSSINNDSEGLKGGDSRQGKMQKTNKYKMKIITSHQVEIQGGNQEPNYEQIEKEIMEQIRTGKINISDYNAEKPPQLMIGCSSQKGNSKEKPVYTVSMYNSDHKEQNRSKDSSESQNKQSRGRQESGGVNNSSSQGGKVTYTTKMKNISEILQKIGVRNTASQHNRKSQPQEKNAQLNPKTEPEREEKKQPQYPSIPNTTTPHNRMDKSQKVEVKGQEKKTEKYADKMRQAKSRAEQLLKEFTKKKQ